LLSYFVKFLMLFNRPHPNFPCWKHLISIIVAVFLGYQTTSNYTYAFVAYFCLNSLHYYMNNDYSYLMHYCQEIKFNFGQFIVGHA